MYIFLSYFFFFFFFNDTATTEIYTLSLHDALPISRPAGATRVPTARERPARSATSVSDRTGLVSAGPRAVAAQPGRLLQHGIRAQRGSADLLGRSGERRG